MGSPGSTDSDSDHPASDPSASDPSASDPSASDPVPATLAAAEITARLAAAAIADRTGIAEHSIAVVLGSGWRPAAAVLGAAEKGDGGTGAGVEGAGVEATQVTEIPMAELPGFAPPSAAGHGGTVQSITVGGTAVLVLLGRTHAYEGHDLLRVVHPIRTAAAAGAHTVILTNAAGGLRADMSVGQAVLISDHLNLTARSPLVGAQFVDLVDAYDPQLRALARTIDPSLSEGVYAGLPGPHYETPAEIRMLRTLGADLVGMSTVHETIAARAAGLRVLAISLVTNLAAGMTGEPLNHDEVLAAGQASAQRMGGLLRTLVSRL